MSKSHSGALRRVAVGLVAGALTISVVALAPSAGATSAATGDRIAGNNRYGTAEAIARQPEFTAATTAILATGENFPDALAASGLAGKNGPAPIVLTQRNTYTAEAHDAFKALPALKNVIIVGGTSAVSDTVKNAVTADGYTVTRTAGNDRYETASAIAESVGAASVGSVAGKKTALIANGENFPDALAGGPAAYKNKMPILLVHPGSVPASTTKALQDLGIKHSIILGGTAAVSDATKAAIDTATGGDSERLADVNRFGTAVKVANFELTTLGFDGKEILLANGQNFPDALAGGPLGGDPRPILLVTPTTDPTETNGFCDAHSNTENKVIALGGTAAVGANVLADCVTAAKNTANDNPAGNTGVTARPELASASMRTVTAATATAIDPVGTTISYLFDKPVTGAVPDCTLFHIYNADRTSPQAVADSCAVSTTDTKTVNVRFNTLQTSSSVANVTVATVDAGAVVDSTGSTHNAALPSNNPEGDSPLGTSGTAASAGVTNAPDLVSVGNFRLGASTAGNGVTAIDFTFDEAATVQGTAGYTLVRTVVTNQQVACTGPAFGSTTVSGTTSPGGNGTTVITVTCPNDTLNVALSPANFARGLVDTGTVKDSTGVANPFEAADISNGGNSDSPDLVSAVFAPDAQAGIDSVVFIFDEDVQAPTDGTKFFIYKTDGSEVAGITIPSASPVRSPNSNAAVAVAFPDGSLDGAVGASVDDAAVTDLQGNPGVADEVAVAPTSTATTSTGRTSAPDLIAVRSADTGSAFAPSRTITYVFDEDTNPTVTAPTKLFIYLPDGTRAHCTGATSISPFDQTTRSEATDNEVACTGFTLDNGGTATLSQISNAVLGSVDDGAVTEQTGGSLTNPEGSEVISGSSGTPTA